MSNIKCYQTRPADPLLLLLAIEGAMRRSKFDFMRSFDVSRFIRQAFSFSAFFAGMHDMNSALVRYQYRNPNSRTVPKFRYGLTQKMQI
jgi:hypothetical protein